MGSTQADLLTVGASDLDIFAGLNGGTANAVGLSLTGASFALALMSDRNDTERKWKALKAGAEAVEILGIPDVTVSGSNLAVAINSKALDGSVIDFTKNDVQIATGVDEEVNLDFKGALVQASGAFDINISEFFRVSGEFAFKKSTDIVTLADTKGDADPAMT
jgi:hypothetical protein